MHAARSHRNSRAVLCAALALTFAPMHGAVHGSPSSAVVGESTTVRRVRVLMGAPCSVTAHAESPTVAAQGVEDALDEIARMEALLSTYRDDSSLSRVNRLAGREPAPLRAELAEFLGTALRLARATGGAFDPTVGSLVGVWDLRGVGRVPEPPVLERARRAVGYRKVHLVADGTAVEFADPGLWIDPG